MKKTIDVCAPVLTRAGKPYQEARMEDGLIVLKDGKKKRPDQMRPDDELVMENVPLGRLLIMALDTSDDAMTPGERRKRFRLSCEIEDAMQDKELFEFDTEDRKSLESAADLVKNAFFHTRIYEAIEMAEPVKDKPSKPKAVA